MKTALLVVDLQRDFCPGGALAVEDGDRVVEPANQLIELFELRGWPVYFTRDWHPENHCSFEAQGGAWPAHCIAGTPGAEFHQNLQVPKHATVISKADEQDKEAYSGFEGTDLRDRLVREKVDSVIVAGLTLDYCVKTTALDAHRFGLEVCVAIDAVRAVNTDPGDGRRAIMHMQVRGVHFRETPELIEELSR
jgi:nicotinamidase/pyrazinamidase